MMFLVLLFYHAYITLLFSISYESVQLLQHFKIKNAADMLDQRYSAKMDTKKAQYKKNMQSNIQAQNKSRAKIQQPRINLKYTNQFYNKLQQNQRHNEPNIGYKQKTNKSKEDKQKTQQYNQLQISNVSSLYIQQRRPPIIQRMIKNKSKAMLETDQQMQVQEFIEGEVKKGNRLSMQQIADKAKQISKRKGKNYHKFQASIGWVRHFLKRYPEMRQLYIQSRQQTRSNYPRSYQLKYRSKLQKDTPINNQGSHILEDYYRPQSQQHRKQKRYLQDQGKDDLSQSYNLQQQQYSNYDQYDYHEQQEQPVYSEERPIKRNKAEDDVLRKQNYIGNKQQKSQKQEQEQDQFLQYQQDMSSKKIQN